MWRRHRRALRPRVLAPGPGGEDASTLLLGIAAVSLVGVVAAGGDQPPLGVAERARVAGQPAVGAGGPDNQGVGIAVVRRPEPEEVGVPSGEDGYGAVRPGVLDAVRE